MHSGNPHSCPNMYYELKFRKLGNSSDSSISKNCSREGKLISPFFLVSLFFCACISVFPSSKATDVNSSCRSASVKLILQKHEQKRNAISPTKLWLWQTQGKEIFLVNSLSYQRSTSAVYKIPVIKILSFFCGSFIYL